MSKNITTPWTFKDGREYVLSLTVVEHSTLNASLSLKLSDKVTAEEWSCSYDSKYVENLTHRTGSFKPFHVFMSMLQSALLKKSESVALDLMNLADLENLRSQKGPVFSTTTILGSEGRMNNNFKPNGEMNSSFSDHAGNGFKDKLCQNNESGSSKKKYLIVTYVAEFDRVHYPIPFNYSGPPNLQVMQKNIFQLRSEVQTLRNVRTALEEEVVSLKQTQGRCPTSQNVGISSNLNCGITVEEKKMTTGVEMDMTNDSCPKDTVLIGKLTFRISDLEEKLETERTDHQHIIEKLQAENDFLQQKLNASEKYEERLEDEIYLLTHGTSFRRTRPSQIYNETYKQMDGKKEKADSRNLLNIWNSGDNNRRKTSFTHLGRMRSSPGISPLPRRSHSVSPSPNRKPSFDPTAYIREKKLQQDRMAKLRLDKIKSQLQNRVRDSSSRSSSVEGNKQAGRTRSVSRESRISQKGSLNPRTLSQSPQRRTSTVTNNRKLDNLYKEIDERLGRERNRSLGRRNGFKLNQSPTHLPFKKKVNSQIPIALHAHVDKILREERLLFHRSSKNKSMAAIQDRRR